MESLTKHKVFFLNLDFRKEIIFKGNFAQNVTNSRTVIRHIEYLLRNIPLIGRDEIYGTKNEEEVLCVCVCVSKVRVCECACVCKVRVSSFLSPLELVLRC